MQLTNARPGASGRAARHCKPCSRVAAMTSERSSRVLNQPTRRFERAPSTVSIESSATEHNLARLPSANAAFQRLRAELASTANGACRIARNANVAPLHRQCIDNHQTSCERLARPGKHFERFAGLHRADDADERPEHAHRRAARFLELVAFSEQTVITRAVGHARVEHRNLTVEA